MSEVKRLAFGLFRLTVRGTSTYAWVRVRVCRNVSSNISKEAPMCLKPLPAHACSKYQYKLRMFVREVAYLEVSALSFIHQKEL
jgi:hypothetical protein